MYIGVCENAWLYTIRHINATFLREIAGENIRKEWWDLVVSHNQLRGVLPHPDTVVGKESEHPTLRGSLMANINKSIRNPP